jgi:succinate dehydrogenase / fumarate reductase flavoprotein subunit
MQGLADGYFVLPYTIGDYFASNKKITPSVELAEFKEAESRHAERLDGYLKVNGNRSVDSFHRELGKIMWNECGMARSAQGLKKAIERIPQLHDEFRRDVRVLGVGKDLNVELEKAGRVDDYFEFAELMCRDALAREESCGGHFRVEHQTDEGEARRNDDDFCHVAAWEYAGSNVEPIRHQEELAFETVKLQTRSYK